MGSRQKRRLTMNLYKVDAPSLRRMEGLDLNHDTHDGCIFMCFFYAVRVRRLCIQFDFSVPRRLFPPTPASFSHSPDSLLFSVLLSISPHHLGR